MSDELLNYYGDKYVNLRIGLRLQISFERYLADPEAFEQTLLYLTICHEHQ